MMAHRATKDSRGPILVFKGHRGQGPRVSKGPGLRDTRDTRVIIPGHKETKGTRATRVIIPVHRVRKVAKVGRAFRAAKAIRVCKARTLVHRATKASLVGRATLVFLGYRETRDTKDPVFKGSRDTRVTTPVCKDRRAAKVGRVSGFKVRRAAKASKVTTPVCRVRKVGRGSKETTLECRVHRV